MNDKKQLDDLRRQLSQLQRSRAHCKGDPDALRDLREREEDLKQKISNLDR